MSSQSLKLKFDYYPNEVTYGEPFDVAVLVVDEEDVPQSDYSGGQVTLEALGLVPPLSVEVENGEALFNGVVIYPDFCLGGLWGLSVSGDGFEKAVSDPVELRGDTSIKRPTTGDVSGTADGSEASDEDTKDVVELTNRLRVARGAKVKHYIMLLKGRLWGEVGNGERIADAGTCSLMNDILSRCDSDTAIEVVAFYEALLSNPSGNPIFSCAACRSLIRADDHSVTRILSTQSGLVFHDSCLSCKHCGKGLSTDPYVKDGNDIPYHAKCAESLTIPNLASSPSQRCTVVELPPETKEISAPILQHLQSAEQLRFCTLLKDRHLGDEYVRDRLKRMMAKLSPAVKEFFRGKLEV
jgi:hypothetical protein